MLPKRWIPRLQGFDYTRDRTYFVTFCVRDRARSLDDPRAAGVAQRGISDLSSANWYSLYAYCVMPDHVHVLFRLRRLDQTLSPCVGLLKRKITLGCRTEGIDVRWQSGFHDRIVREYE